MTDDRQLLVNLRNRQRAEVPLPEDAIAARGCILGPSAEELADRQHRAEAADRLCQAARGGDQLAADVLTLLGVPWRE